MEEIATAMLVFRSAKKKSGIQEIRKMNFLTGLF